MQNDELRRMVRLTGYVYLPITLFVVIVFVLVVFYRARIAQTQEEFSAPPPASHLSASSTLSL